MEQCQCQGGTKGCEVPWSSSSLFYGTGSVLARFAGLRVAFFKIRVMDGLGRLVLLLFMM